MLGGAGPEDHDHKQQARMVQTITGLCDKCNGLSRQTVMLYA